MIRTILCLSIIVSTLFAAVFVSIQDTYALDNNARTGFKSGLDQSGGTNADDCKAIGGKLNADQVCVDKDGKQINTIAKTIQNIINLLLYLAGAIAVIIIIIGGFRYVTSNGDPGAASKAKNTIIYAVIGLVVAASAYALVNFILGNI